jgi:hypothetical protein
MLQPKHPIGQDGWRAIVIERNRIALHAPAAYNLAQGRWHRLKTSLIQSVKEASWVLLETRVATYKGCHR